METRVVGRSFTFMIIGLGFVALLVIAYFTYAIMFPGQIMFRDLPAHDAKPAAAEPSPAVPKDRYGRQGFGPGEHLGGGPLSEGATPLQKR